MKATSQWLCGAASGAIVKHSIAIILLVGCTSQPLEPIPVSAAPAAVIWTHTHYRPGFFSLTDYATVTRIDDTKVINWQPLKVDPGIHRVEISYSRSTLLCGYLGCVDIERSRNSFDLVAEGGHSYMPFALQRCEAEWVGILDTGNSLREDYALEYSLTWQFGELTRLATPWKVIAGVAPPADCSEGNH